MNKISLFLVSASLLWTGRVFSAAPTAMVSASASPSTQSVLTGGSFNVSISLSVTAGSGPANVLGFDLYLVTGSANAFSSSSGYFTIKAAVPGAFTGAGPTEPSGGDMLTMAASSGYIRNAADQGFSGATQPVPTTNLPLETLTLSVAPGTPNGTYSFQTSTSATAGTFYSRIADGNGTTYEITSPGVFSITVVPEPSSVALLAVGAGLLGVVARRRQNRRVA